MPILTCHVCGRVVDTAESTEPLILEERRCPRCGSPLAEPGADASMPDAARAAAVAALPERIAFLGFGLIGASIALGLREAGYAGSLVAWTPSGRDPGEGVRRRFLDEASTDRAAAIGGAGLIVLAASPRAIGALIGDLAGELRPAIGPASTITDVASTKAMLVDLASAQGLPFVGGHPMAGREATGAGAAVANLFEGRPWVVVPSATAEQPDIDKVVALANAVGARPVRVTGEEHDDLVAAISHLPLVAAVALVEAVVLAGEASREWPVARGLAATGWADMTRLARGSSDMGTGILETNAPAIASRLRTFRDVIDTWIAELEGEPSVERIKHRLDAARSALADPGDGAP